MELFNPFHHGGIENDVAGIIGFDVSLRKEAVLEEQRCQYFHICPDTIQFQRPLTIVEDVIAVIDGRCGRWFG